MSDLDRVFALVGKELDWGGLPCCKECNFLATVDRVHVGRATYGAHVTIWGGDMAATWHGSYLPSVIRRCLDDCNDD